MKTDFPIDLVYLWCDNSDEDWMAKKQKYYLLENNLDQQAACASRYIDNDELKYSLRSVEKNAPWINHIYIVTDHQTPSWLNIGNPKITMVNHEDILPKENLPVFNSEAIEIGLANIEGLSEHFLFANDDCFLGDTVFPEDFFLPNGKVIVRLIKDPKKSKKKRSQYDRHITDMQNLIKKTFNKKLEFHPHHNFDAYLKSEFHNCVECFSELSSLTAKQRFRNDLALQRSIFGFWLICKNIGIPKVIKKWKSKLINKLPFLSKYIRVDSMSCGICSAKALKRLAKVMPKMFCLNDSEKADISDRQNIKRFMENLFSEKSQFEK